ncbi:MAG: hypothetical protein J4F42_02950 [Desulfurellaceae bacterium]|nr:hypothetical protein [Desulfurellaceae bacterium]
MSERLVFDTHRFVRDLVSAGMAESIAETLAEKQVELLSGNLATKGELAQVEANLKAELTQVEANLRTELATTTTSLIKRMVTIMTACTAAMTVLVTALARSLAG